MLKLQKGWRRWLMIGFLVFLGILAVMAFATGCSSGSSSGATSTNTPLTALQADVDAVEASVDTLETNVWEHGNSIATMLTRLTNLETAKTGLEARIGNLETANTDTTDVDMASIEARIAFLEIQYEGLVNPTPTPTATPSGSPTIIPTPTPVVYCGIHRPAAVYPPASSTTIPNGSVLFQWSEAINAVKYEFWFGTDSSSMTKVKEIDDFSVTSYLHPVPLANTYYFWKIIVRDACGNVQTDSWWFKTAP